MTEKQRLYIEALTRELGIGRTWADGVRFVLGRVPWSRYNNNANRPDKQALVSRVIETLAERAEWERHRRRQTNARAATRVTMAR